MRQVREVLRLKHGCGLSDRAIGRALRISYTTVADYVHRAAYGGVRWPLPDELDDAELERRLFRRRQASATVHNRIGRGSMPS